MHLERIKIVQRRTEVPVLPVIVDQSLDFVFQLWICHVWYVVGYEVAEAFFLFESDHLFEGEDLLEQQEIAITILVVSHLSDMLTFVI